ncbi:MAG: PTS sugar transporter subunit IIC [Mycoplasma sp.]|nr:PTS sugar transporter subunit IIC [Mycoplasma sp.]
MTWFIFINCYNYKKLNTTILKRIKMLKIQRFKNPVWHKIKNGFINGANILGNQRHLAALRDAFALFTPLVIIGSLSVVMRTFIFGASGGSMTSILGWIAKAANQIKDAPQYINPRKGIVIAHSWTFLGNYAAISDIGNFAFYAIERATYGAISLYLAFGIGYFISRSRNNDSPVICGVTTLSAVIAANGSIGWGPTFYIDSSGLMTTIIFGFISAELFCILSKSKRLLIIMPVGVPQSVAKSFAKFIPILIILSGISVFQILFMSFSYGMSEFAKKSKISHWGETRMTIGDAIFYGVQTPFLKSISNKSADLSLGLIYVFSVSILWFFGIHGSNVMNGIIGVTFISFLSDNISSEQKWFIADSSTHIFVQGTFDAFIMLGGTGSTLGWIIASFLFSKRKQEKQLTKFAIPASIFNINEPIIFGVPMMVNPTYSIPFIFTAPLLTLITYFSIAFKAVPLVKVWIPWTIPAPIGGLVATSMSWQGFILAFINLSIATLLYTPFIMGANIKAKREGGELTYALVKFGKRTELEKTFITAEKAKRKQDKILLKEARKKKEGNK